jgi:outer membrane protein assembly factor BamB
VNSLAGQTASDSFTATSLDSDWTFGDATGTSSYSLTSNPGHLQINVPGGSSHDCFPPTFNCANMLRKGNNVDATYETKIDGVNFTSLSTSEQTYGIMVWQDNQNYMIFVYYTDGTGSVKVAATSVFSNVGTLVASATVTGGLGASNYLRVTRTGTTYTVYYSQNGSSWTTVSPSITAPGGFVVNKVGTLVSNSASNLATTGNFDYFNVSEIPRNYGGKIFTFHNEVTELPTGEKRMLEAVADQAEVQVTQSVAKGSGDVQIGGLTWLTSRGNPGALSIDLNINWKIDFAAKSSSGAKNAVLMRIFKYTPTSATVGTYTQVLTTSNSSLLTTSKAQYTVGFSFSIATTLTSTAWGPERLAFRLYATQNSATATTVTLYLEGTNNNSVTSALPTSNVYAFSDIYNTVGSPNQQPLCLWQKAIGQGMGKIDGSSIALSLDGSRIYLACTDGKVYCLNTADGSTVWTYNTLSTIRNSSPYYDYAYDQIWIGSEDGRLHQINGINGTLVAKSTSKISTHATQYAIHSTPVRYSFGGIDVVLVGTDDGKVYRVNPNNLDALIADSGSNTSYNLTSTGTAAAADAIWGTPIFDVGTNSMAVAVNGAFYKVNLATGAKSKSTLFTAGSIMYSSPAIDWDNNFAYVGGGTKLWKTDYLAWPATTNFSTVTQGTNPDNTYPRSSPLWVSGATDWMYMGDGGGYMNRFTANNSSANPPLFASFLILSTAADSDSPIIMDYFTGNVYFGATNGRVYQLSQTF